MKANQAIVSSSPINRPKRPKKILNRKTAITAKIANPSRFRNMVVSLGEAGQGVLRADVSISFIGNISDCELRCYRRGWRAGGRGLCPGASARRPTGAGDRARRRHGPGL